MTEHIEKANVANEPCDRVTWTQVKPQYSHLWFSWREFVRNGVPLLFKQCSNLQTIGPFVWFVLFDWLW